MSSRKNEIPSTGICENLPFDLSLNWSAGDANSRLVEYILLSEFDIDTGSTCKVQYPRDIPHIDPDWFAEQMLPEGAHNRDLDWSLWFLNRDRYSIDESTSTIKVQDNIDSVNMNESKRKAGNINGTNKSNDDKTKESHEKQTKETDNNNDDDDDDDIEKIVDKVANVIKIHSRESSVITIEETHTGVDPFLYCYNIVIKKSDKTVRRGAIVKALALCSPYQFIHVFQTHMILTLEKYINHPDIDILKEFYNNLNSLDLSKIPRATPYEKKLMSRGITNSPLGERIVAHTPKDWTFKTRMKLHHIEVSTIPVNIPLYLSSDECGERSIIDLINVFGDDVMRIYNGIISGKKILFVGYNHAAGDVCRMVLSAAALVSPPLPGILTRVFPYGNLTDLSFLEIPGYIAGVTNPMFESKSDWWDILCVLDLPNGRGTVTTKEELNNKNDYDLLPIGTINPEQQQHLNTVNEVDQNFIAKIRSGIDYRMGEAWVKVMFVEFTQNIIDIAIIGSSSIYDEDRARESIKKFVLQNEKRIKDIKLLKEFRYIKEDPWEGIRDKLNMSGKTLWFNIKKLEVSTNLTDAEAEYIYGNLAGSLHSEAALQILLGLLTELNDGFHPFVSGILHRSHEVRMHTCILLHRMELYKSTTLVVSKLNRFLMLAYQRVCREIGLVIGTKATEFENNVRLS